MGRQLGGIRVRRWGGVGMVGDDAAVTAARTNGPGSDPVIDFTAFFRVHYRTLVRVAMYAGADLDEAKDAASDAMVEICQRWFSLSQPLGYARRAVISHFLKARQRGLERVRLRQVQRAAGTPIAEDDPRLSAWEDQQWVAQLLEVLSPHQRQTMAYLLDGYSTVEIAQLLGSSPDAVRQRLLQARKRLRQALQQELQQEQQSTANRYRDGR